MGIIEKLYTVWGPVQAVFASFRFPDFLDICLVAFLLYSAIKLIRDTRTLQLVKGLILIGVIYLIISALNMQASTYIFDKLFSNIVVVLIIVFQPEIRHVIESMGKSRFKGIGNMLSKSEQIKYNERISSDITAVCKACSSMSDRKIGALMVFERGTILGDIIKTGTIVNGDISEELIENIFFPKASLHDGAAVIRDGRLYAAGCILPLTENHDDVSSELGTRHRAAIGMSEKSDALIVVVSEETGSISTAFKGALNLDISDGQLREILGDMLLIKETRGENDHLGLRGIFARGNKNEK